MMLLRELREVDAKRVMTYMIRHGQSSSTFSGRLKQLYRAHKHL